MSDMTAFFNPCFERLAPIDKVDNRNVLNLSSNEAHHSGFTNLFEEFIRGYNVSLVTKYPVFREAHNLSGDYHGVPIDQLMLAPGSDFAINLLTNAIGKNTEGLITHSPNYTGYLHYAMLQNMSIQCMETIDLEFLSKYKCHMVAITNPEGFLGSVIPFDRMVEIAEVCKKQKHILLIDEAYIEFNTFEHKDLIRKFDNIIIVRSYSKGMGLASMRLGVIISNSTIINYLRRFASENSISDISLSYLIFLIKHRDQLRLINTEICATRQKLIGALKSAHQKWYVYDSHTNFITIGMESKQKAIAVMASLMQKKIRIRHLMELASIDHCIRITVPSTHKAPVLLDALAECYLACC